MVDALIFSRDRPAQLDACVRSLAENAPQIRTPHVLYTVTNGDAWDGYEQIEGAVMISESSSFEETVRAVLPTLSEHVLLLCDDAITYRRLPGGDLSEAMTDDVICLSLRLGANTLYCHPRDLIHGLPPWDARPPFMVWDWHRDPPEGDLFEWQGREGDFGYPYSLDGTIHRRDSILEWIAGMPFQNPNQMEGCVVASIGQRRDLPSFMACYPLSCQVGLPINVVNTTHRNRWGTKFPVDTAELNRRFLDGERIDYRAMDFSAIVGAHQELPLRFMRND